MHLHRFGDLVVASELELTQLPSIEGASPECSLRVRPPAPLAELPWIHHWRRADGSISLSCARAGDDYVLGFPGLAHAAISEGARLIELLPERELTPETIEHLVNDQILPRVAAFRGRLVLHAGCVATSSGACAFLGGSGAGKSTLCAGFVLEGDRLLGDDGIFVRPSGPGIFEAEATYPGLRLLPHSLGGLWTETPQTSVVAADSDKRRLQLGEPGAYPLRALYVLDEPVSGDAPETIEAALLTPREGFVALLRAAFHLHVGDPARTRRLFEQLSALLDAVPVRSVRYARRLDLLPGVRHEVLRDLAEAILPV